MIEPAVRTILAENGAVAALVSGRVYFNAAAQDERRPRIVLTLVSALHYHTLDGNAGYTTGRMQADCLAPTYREAKELTEAARNALDDYTGTVAGTEIDFIEADEERDVPAAPLAGRAVPTFGVSLEFRFMHK